MNSMILASSSPRRAQLLRELELDFQVVTQDIPEFHYEHLTPQEVAQLNAHRKARAVAKKFPDALVIGADTIVCLGSKIFGKPKDFQEAYSFLHQLQGRTHRVITGVALIHLRTHQERLFIDTTEVRFKKLTAEEIRSYLRVCQPLDKAGAYAIQSNGDAIISKIRGSRSNVIGLPMEKLQEELERIEQSIAAHV